MGATCCSTRMDYEGENNNTTTTGEGVDGSKKKANLTSNSRKNSNSVKFNPLDEIKHTIS